jgi:hypothetical protein
MRPYRLRAAAPLRWHWRPARRAASAGARSPAPPAARYRAVTQRFPEALQWSALTAAARVEASSGAQADESLGKELGRDALAASHQRGGHAYLHALDLTGLAGVTRTGGKRQGGGEGEPSGRVRQRYPDQGLIQARCSAATSRRMRLLCGPSCWAQPSCAEKDVIRGRSCTHVDSPSVSRGSPNPPKQLQQTYYGVWRSPVARLLWEQEVPGSNPGAPISGNAEPTVERARIRSPALGRARPL